MKYPDTITVPEHYTIINHKLTKNSIFILVDDNRDGKRKGLISTDEGKTFKEIWLKEEK